MDSSDFLKKQEDDKDIRLFQEEYPEINDGLMRLLEREYEDEAVHILKEEYSDIYDGIQKMIDREWGDEAVKILEEEYPDIYIAVRKMVERQIGRVTEAKPQRTPYKKGDFIGKKYEVYDVLGVGGFGIVYLVYSHEMESVYALKTFSDEYLEDIRTRERFKKEAQVWIDLERHPYLVRAYFVDKISDRLFIAMEYIAPDEQGLNSLDDYLRCRPPDLAQTLRWSIQFCYGMEYAYSKGIRAHRDIKPANIMVGQHKAVKISDFGLAGVISDSKSFTGINTNTQRDISAEAYQTMEGTAFGTPPYMPPEQFENAAGCDKKSDIYSFGIVLYQMASGGKLPFYPDMSVNRGNDVFKNWYMLHCKASIPKMKSPLFPVIQKCLAKEPHKRFRSFKNLQSELEPIFKQLTGEVVKLPEQKEMEAWEWNNKGLSLNRLGKLQEAIACYEKALEIDPLSAKAWYNKGCILSEIGKHQEAIDSYDQALKINPVDVKAWYNKAVVLAEQDKHLEAIDCYDQALKINPKLAEAWNNKGVKLAAISKDEEAIDCYDKALKINRGYASAWNNKGLSLAKLGNHREAIDCYDQALKINPKLAEAWYGKALTEDKLQNNQSAAFSYKRLIELAPAQYKEQIEYARQRLRELEGR